MSKPQPISEAEPAFLEVKKKCRAGKGDKKPKRKQAHRQKNSAAAEAPDTATRDEPSRQTSLVGFLPEIDTVAGLVRTEIAKLKQANVETPNDSRVRELVSLTRLLQTLCDLACDARRAEQEQNGGGRDILQFRKQLEKKIAALGEEGEDR